MSFLETLLGVFAVLMLVPVTVLFVQVLMALPVYRPRPVPQDKRPTVCLLVPAHDEAAVIATTLNSIAPQLVDGDRLLVVADNCSDETASIARGLGAEVIVRTDPERRGKGYALDFGIRHIRENPAEVVIIVDADCEVCSGTIEWLAYTCGQLMRPVQALDLMISPADAGLKTRIAEFAWVVKNQVRPLGYHRLGLPCQLMGTGMAFPWPVIRDAALASGHIVEDLKLGIDLAMVGMAAQFCPEALVTSVFPATEVGIRSQRTRWEHGHIGAIQSDAPRLLLNAMWKRDGSLMALVLDLCVPPLALLCTLVVTQVAVSGVFALVADLWLPLFLAATSLAMLGFTVFIAWWSFGRHILSLGNLAYAPLYAIWKIPLYLKYMIGRRVEWVRTRRDGE